MDNGVIIFTEKEILTQMELRLIAGMVTTLDGRPVGPVKKITTYTGGVLVEFVAFPGRGVWFPNEVL